ncbi:MAG: Protein TolQ [Gammaproteobacteria bacterium]|nr:Protein TolQ [Gammaproteobacteria bacterium]
MENAINLAAPKDTISIMALVMEASLLVQLVMLILLLASVISWTMIFTKYFNIKTASRDADNFEDDFWSGGDMDTLFHTWAGRGRHPEGMASIFVAGYREYTRLGGKASVGRQDMLDAVHRTMRVALMRETDELETHLSFLATVGSTSPYVGLFGTVWGIMNSFRSLGVAQQATIASVAPGIAEALVATAMGLFAAIPAVIAYNRFSNRIERLLSRYEAFADEFLSIVNRQTMSSKTA